ncbi:DMT family transporter [Pelagicoccus sp. SDUM812003]|uniref:DMT family transporter n=1 Tax=Pelagicoccus sp. SDUM812003 TaxID=3041267 RepID=UPI00280F99F5|nr:DMT family transporter [Pelagicoccus sp. SDUM812003]MDQ8202997.1 DMT family transporter [Pelagicoccus sp. SDUM812003]
MLRILLLLSGVFFCSTSVIIIRSSELPPALVAAYRLLFASILLSPVFFLAWRKHRKTFAATQLKRCLIPAGLLAVHFISWAWGARLTYVANATLIINLTPMVMPFLAHFLIREQVTRREILGTLIALSGVIVLSYGAFRIDPSYLKGNIVCFASMTTFAAYLAYGRINKDFPSIWLYMVPIYAMAALLCFAFSAASLDSLSIVSWREVALMLGMAVLPTTLGHVALNRSLRYFAAQTLAVVNLHQFVFAGILGWIIFSDVPPGSFFLAAALCVSGAVVVVREAARVAAERRRGKP